MHDRFSPHHVPSLLQLMPLYFYVTSTALSLSSSSSALLYSNINSINIISTFIIHYDHDHVKNQLCTTNLKQHNAFGRQNTALLLGPFQATVVVAIDGCPQHSRACRFTRNIWILQLGSSSLVMERWDPTNTIQYQKHTDYQESIRIIPSNDHKSYES